MTFLHSLLIYSCTPFWSKNIYLSFIIHLFIYSSLLKTQFNTTSCVNLFVTWFLTYIIFITYIKDILKKLSNQRYVPTKWETALHFRVFLRLKEWSTDFSVYVFWLGTLENFSLKVKFKASELKWVYNIFNVSTSMSLER